MINTIRILSYIVFTLGFIMYCLTLAPNDSLVTFTNSTIWVFCIIFILFMISGGIFYLFCSNLSCYGRNWFEN